jgi:5-methylcytosine-specific restriction endonuclease McrBC regulatory subunit McrC
MHIAKHSIGAPQIVDSEIFTDSSKNFWEVLAHWYVTRLEEILKFDLYRDYRSEVADLRLIRGTVNPIHSTINWFSGRPVMSCKFDEFDSDNALNRTLLEALMRISNSRHISSSQLMKRARLASHRMESVGGFTNKDLSFEFDRSGEIWRTSYELATRIINATGESISTGLLSGQSFLIRTPSLIEDGIREILNQRLNGFVRVSKRSLTLIPETMSANPDLVIEGQDLGARLPPILLNDGFVVGDVKYKTSDGKWYRPDLSQLVFFASAYQSNAGFLVNFKTNKDVAAGVDALIGGVPYRMITWDTTLSDPREAESKFVREVRQWIVEVSSNSSNQRALRSA